AGNEKPADKAAGDAQKAAPAAPAPAAAPPAAPPAAPVPNGQPAGAQGTDVNRSKNIVDPFDAYKRILGRLPPVWIEGYVTPWFGVQYRPDPPAPRFRLDYGFALGAGVLFRSDPFPMWRGLLNLAFNYRSFRVGTIPVPVDTNGDGLPDVFRFEIQEL